MSQRFSIATLCAGAAMLVLAACGSSSGPGSASTSGTSSGTSDPDLSGPSASLTGAGSTFDQPFFTRAFYDYNQKNSGVTVTYASIGSGGGIAQFQAQTVNFGASDVPMSASDIASAKGGTVLQVPVALGGEAISYNLSGVKGGLHLTGTVLAEIYLGQIKTWNDPAIAALNGGVTLPSQAITVVHRSDGSGTSYIFTNYLSTISPAWSSGPGTGKTVKWPVGLGGKGNEGVAGLVKQVSGSIGYVELAYALQNNFTFAAIQNPAGSWVEPSLATVASDAAQKPTVSSTNFSIVNEMGSNSYPISGYSWTLVYETQTNTNNGTALVKVLDWLTHAGQADAQALDYVPLPANIQQLARTTLQMVVDSSGKKLLS
jgi:phosphate transport system substrate-binding protein